jgi:hypothetical protein
MESREQMEQLTELPDPFVFADGSWVKTPRDWARRRKEILDLVVGLEYGGLPPSGAGVDAQLLHNHKPGEFEGGSYVQFRLVLKNQPAFHFRLDLAIPPGDGPFPVILNGDGCYRFVTPGIVGDVLRRRMILAQFSRVEIVPDIYKPDRDTGLYPVYPESTFGAVSAWAWGYHRCVDALGTMKDVDASRIAVVGHSRGGKAVLLAGATDERIAVTAPNASGCGGAGSFYCRGRGCERIADLIKVVPYWFGPRLREYAGREEQLPFDQHFLKALVAPRALISTEGLDDLWANPIGTRRTHEAAGEVYRFLDAPGSIAISYRPGDHDHNWDDWQVFLDFAQWQFGQAKPTRDFNINPYPAAKPAFTWRAPAP